ncbi:MAG: hypothetical protein PHE55_06720 [Methylococcaceae bacterium]|nr:hypothetical protein [Methylococcaceae bacterium]
MRAGFSTRSKSVREWQQQAQAYNDCVVREANADSEIIAKSANAEQEQFRAAVEKIKATASATKAKLDRQ